MKTTVAQQKKRWWSDYGTIDQTLKKSWKKNTPRIDFTLKAAQIVE